jgi:hypothetical protein
MPGGSILLGAVAARTATIEIACRACPRHGQRRTETPLRERGPAMGMPDLLRILAGDCPRLNAAGSRRRCDVHCPTLSTLFTPVARLI